MVSPYERGLAEAGTRKVLGAYYTPSDVVREVLDLCLEPLLATAADRGPAAVAALRVVDPACGTGNFLAAAAGRIARTLATAGVDRQEAHRVAVAECVVGIDIDPEAAARCQAALEALAPGARARVRSFDSLLDEPAFGVGSFDLVVGNPPYLSQLDAATARSGASRAALRERYGDVLGAYTDPAALFLIRSLELARPDGGVVALLEPVSILSAADARGVRSAVVRDARLRALWSLEARVFDASVQVCLPVLERTPGRSPRPRVELFAGRDRRPAGAVPGPSATQPTWSALLAELAGVPQRTLRTQGTIGDLAVATADFRDQFYGLAPYVVDRRSAGDGRWPRLVTTGLVDPAELAWGVRDTTFNKVRYRYPRVDREALPADVRAWAERRLVPKIVVATQTRVIESLVDEAGDLVPSVPLLTVTASPDQLWAVAAALSAPALTLEAVRRHLGSGRNPKAVRLRAAELVELPLPASAEPWRAAARELTHAHADGDGRRRDHLAEVGRLMNQAYGLGDDEELLGWWLGRLPSRSR